MSPATPNSPAAKTIQSVSDAIAALNDDALMRDIRPEENLKRGDADFGLWFRGHEKLNYQLLPSILREAVEATSSHVDEVSLTRHFKATNADAAALDAPDFEWLVTMQHYLAPTRLLDWTENFLVALYFAVRNPALDGQEDSAVWLLNARRLNYYASAISQRSEVLFADEPDVIARSGLCRVRNRQEWFDVCSRELKRRRVDREDYRLERMLTGIQPMKLARGAVVRAFGVPPAPLAAYPVVQGGRSGALNVFEKDGGWATPERLAVRLAMPVAVYPYRTNRRIRSQSGVFTLHGGGFVPNPQDYAKDKAYSAPIGLPVDLTTIDHCLERKRILKWLCIPKEKRAEFRQTLARIGINDAALFPELDYQSRYLIQRWKFNNESYQHEPD
jgi:hypothetical protein